jgi:hypothetical protein
MIYNITNVIDKDILDKRIKEIINNKIYKIIEFNIINIK